MTLQTDGVSTLDLQQKQTVPPEDDVTQEMINDICGTRDGDYVASDTRTPENWSKYKVGDWVHNT